MLRYLSMKFEARRSRLFALTFGLTIILCFGSSISVFLIDSSMITIIVLSIVILPSISLLAWIWIDTFYQVNDEYFYYRSGPIKGKIRIQDITKLKVNETSWYGVKPALATKGIIISFNRYDEVYVAPKDNDKLVEQLLSRNSNIEVTNKP